MLDRLDDHDRIINHDADGQHQPEERQVVERETERGHHRERAHDRHRHRNQGNQRRPPVLQEQEHHERDQDHGVAQGLEHLAHRLGDERGRVVDDRVVQPVGEPLLELLHLVLDELRGCRARWSPGADRPRGPPTAGRPACKPGRSPGRPARPWPRRAAARPRPAASVFKIMSSNSSAFDQPAQAP